MNPEKLEALSQMIERPLVQCELDYFVTLQEMDGFEENIWESLLFILGDIDVNHRHIFRYVFFCSEGGANEMLLSLRNTFLCRLTWASEEGIIDVARWCIFFSINIPKNGDSEIVHTMSYNTFDVHVVKIFDSIDTRWARNILIVDSNNMLGTISRGIITGK